MTVLAITGGLLLDPVGGPRPGNLLVVDGRVAVSGAVPVPASATRLDAAGLLVAPGLVDLQVNGARGVDLTAEPERLQEVAAALPRHGVTAFLPTVVSSAPEVTRRARTALAALAEPTVAARSRAVPGATPLGLHLEGPMIAASRRGAHPAGHLRDPDLSLVADWSPATGVLLVTLAPELPGALPVIRELTGRGVTVSLGHTEATLAQVSAAEEAGARALTHLFNAMPGLHHREPGPVGAALGGDQLIAGVIVDGVHVHPAAVVAAWRALGSQRFLLVSDATAALDLPGGRAGLGQHEVLVRDGAAWLADRPHTLAGAAVGLAECLRRLVRFTGCAPVEAVTAATLTPARLLCRPDLGRLGPGARGDLVLFDRDLDVVATVVGGRLAYRRDAPPDQKDRTTRADGGLTEVPNGGP